MVKLGGTRMGEQREYRVIVDRISHEVEYYRGYLKHAVLQGTYVINNPFWWTADDKFFNYAVAAKLGIAIPKTILLPQKSYPADVDITSESLRNLKYPVDWEGLLDYVGRPAILKPFSGGGWKHVYKVNNREELLAAYDGTGPYCMTLQEFIDFEQYVRCFTFGKMDIMPVAYDPERAPLPGGARVSVEGTGRARGEGRADHQPSARLRNEYDRVRGEGWRSLRHRFSESGAGFRARPDHRILFRPCACDRMAKLVIDRALQRQRRESLAALGRNARNGRVQPDLRAAPQRQGRRSAPKCTARDAPAPASPHRAHELWRTGARAALRNVLPPRSMARCCGPTLSWRRVFCDELERADARGEAHIRRPHALPVPAPVFS